MAIQYYANQKSQDGVKVTFGDSSDLQIYHDSSNNISFIKNSNAGGLRLQSDELRIFAQNGSTIRADFNTAIKLYYDDSKKFETTTDGIQITDTEGTQIRFVESDSTYTESMRIIRYQDVLGFHYGDNASEEAFTINNTGEATAHKNLTVSGGNITLGGTGIIQGVDTVSDPTDAANKAYVDAHGGGLGPFLPLSAGSTKKLTDTLYIQGTNTTNAESVLLRGVSSNDGDFLGSIRTANAGGYNQEMRFYTSDANGTTDEDLTLTLDASQNATFAGNISAGSGTFSDAVAISHGSGDTLTLTKSTTEPSMRFEGDTDKDFVLTVSGETFTVTQNDGATDILTLDHDTKAATFAGNVTIPSYVFHSGDTNTYFGFSGNDLFQVNTAGGERMRITASGMKLSTSGATVSVILDEDNMSSDSATALATQQSIKAYVDNSISGGANYLGTWDPDDSLNSGYGNPSLEASGRTDDSGDYFICSADGAAHPNGGTSEPDSWNTGDWVIWNEDLGTGGLWQKLDNTTVLSGAGTTNSVAKFTDSETIGDGPITFSSNDSTFAGNITFGDSHFIGDDSDDNLLIQSSANENVVINSPDDDVLIRTEGTTRLQITDTYGIFTTLGGIQLQSDSSVFVAGSSATNGARMTHNGTDAYFLTASGDLRIYNNAQDKDIILRGNDGGSSTVALTLDMSEAGYATFNSGAIFGDLVSGITPVNAANFVTKAYADGLTPGAGVFLPLAGGTLTGGLTGTTGTFSGNVNVSGDIEIDNTSGDPFLKLKTSAQEYVLRIDQSDSEKFQIRNTTSSVTALSIDTSSNATFTGDVNITQTTDVGVLNTTNLDNGSAVGLSLTYPTSNVAAGDGLAIAIGIAGRGRSYIANSNLTTNLDASNLAFYTESGGVIGERMIINQDGKVGIGTGSPNKTLELGYSNTEQNVLLNGLPGGDVGTGILVFNTDTTTDEPFANIDFRAGNADARIAIQRSASNTSNFHFITDSNNTFATKMFLKHSGQLGLGTTDPIKNIEVSYSNTETDTNANLAGAAAGNGVLLRNLAGTGFANVDFRVNDADGRIAYEWTASNTGNFHFITDNAGTIGTKMFIAAGGNVGIGTTSPGTLHGAGYGTTKLHVDGGTDRGQMIIEGDSFAGIVLSDNGATANQRVFATSVDDTKYTIKPLNDNGTSTAGGVAVTVLHGGDVGIGITSPAHKLDVTGDIYSSGQMLTKGSSMACFTVLGDLDTGLGNFDGKGRVSLVSDNKAEITVDKGTIAFDNYTATAVATTGSLIPNQGNQAVTEDTLALLAVDPDGNVVRGSQEGTWTFTKAQLDALATTTSGGTQLIQAPGANKAVIVEESNWMIKYSGTGSMSQNGFEIRQSTIVLADAGISRIPSGQINNIMNSAQGTPTNPSYGFYARDLPQYNNDGRTYKTNAQTVLMRINTNPTPANLVSISIKLKYRLFDAATF